MTITITDYKDIDINQIELTTPEKIKGSHYSFAKYNGEDIYIKTPMLTNLSGIVKLDTRCYMELDMDTSNIETNEFYEFFSNFDDNNILKIHKESLNWFKKPFPLDIVEEFYTSPLKHKTNPKLKIKIPVVKNKIDCQIYDKNNISITNCTKNFKVICVLKFVGLKFLSQQVISEWIPIQIKTNEIANDITMEYLIDDTFINNIETVESKIVENDSEPKRSDLEVSSVKISEVQLNNYDSQINDSQINESEINDSEINDSEIDQVQMVNYQMENLDLSSLQLDELPMNEFEPETLEKNLDEPETVEKNIEDIKRELEKYKQLFETNENRLANIKKFL
tara:strand:- start:757 stop:1767 length:1011 start_codon:yes stop_codon:yes gene_type:complete